MWCILVQAVDFKDVIGPFETAKKAADYSGTRLILKEGRSAVVLQMSDPEILNKDGFKVR